MTWLFALLVAAVPGLFVAELFAWLPWIAERIIRRAAGRLTEPARQRYQDDWLAEIDVLPGGVPKLLFATRLFMVSGRLRQELARPEPPSPEEVPTPTPKASPPPTVRLRTLDPGTRGRLADFTTGESTVWQRDVDFVVGLLASEEGRQTSIRAAEDVATGQIVAVSSYVPLPLLPSHGDTIDDAIYVAVLGVSAAYRDRCLSEQGGSFGDVMLADVLAAIQMLGAPVRPVWGIVHQHNEGARALFRRHGFEPISMAGSEYDIVIRGRGLSLTSS